MVFAIILEYEQSKSILSYPQSIPVHHHSQEDVKIIAMYLPRKPPLIQSVINSLH